MGCLFDANQSQLELISWLLFVKSWTEFAKAQAKIHEANHLKAPTIVLLSLHFSSLDPTNNVIDGWDACLMPTRVSWS